MKLSSEPEWQWWRWQQSQRSSWLLSQSQEMQNARSRPQISWAFLRTPRLTFRGRLGKVQRLLVETTPPQSPSSSAPAREFQPASPLRSSAFRSDGRAEPLPAGGVRAGSFPRCSWGSTAREETLLTAHTQPSCLFFPQCVKVLFTFSPVVPRDSGHASLCEGKTAAGRFGSRRWRNDDHDAFSYRPSSRANTIKRKKETKFSHDGHSWDSSLN